jgi:hypothetical protein
MPPTSAPARYPCASCPYRRDVPSGVWSEEEYDKLPRYDGETGEQLPAAFFCHQQNGRLCSGWVGCHDMAESFGLRIAALQGVVSEEDFEAALDYVCPVPLFASGAEAAAHGMAEVEEPGLGARRVVDKVRARRVRRGLDPEEGTHVG